MGFCSVLALSVQTDTSDVFSVLRVKASVSGWLEMTLYKSHYPGVTSHLDYSREWTQAESVYLKGYQCVRCYSMSGEGRLAE